MDTGNRRGREGAPMSQINVTPLVDVMLVLLIIFMVTASVAQQGITVMLPRAKSEGLPVSEEIVTVTIDASLQVYLNSRRVGLAELGDALKLVYAHRKSKSIFLKADSGVAYGDFVKVVSIIKDSGVEQLGMITEPPKR
jgi:biopolymer transport protein TolR